MAHAEIDKEQGEFIQAFVEEGREMLDEVEPLLIELEQISDESSAVDPEVINTIFRLFHSLKGAAGFLDFETVSSVTHEAETLLDLFRKGAGRLNSSHIDTLTKAADFIRHLLGQIEVEFHDKGVESEAEKIKSELRDMIDGIGGQGKPSSGKKQKAQKKTTSPKKQESDEPASENESAVDGAPQLNISPEMIKQYINESEELLESAEQALLGLEKDGHNDEFVSQAFRALHSFKGNSGFFGYGDLEKVSHQAETVVDKIRESSQPVESRIFSILLEVLDFLKVALAQLNEGRSPDIPGKAGVIAYMEEAIDSISDTGEESEEVAADVEQVAEAPKADAAATAAEDDGKKQWDGVDRRAGADRRVAEDRRTGDRRSQERTSQHQTIRVDIEKLDALLDLIGELVISEAMVSQNPDLKGLNISLDRFEKSVLQLNKITRDIQDIATSIRMIPLSGTFRKMIRLVRDLGQKSGKKVDLELIGEETEVDKTVIEQINDPLVHIIRNSMDHGLEHPDERVNHGKSESGRVTLEAKYVGGEVWILITDDGRGLNRDRIITKGIDRGLITGDGSDLRDEEVWQLIFHPGFSTADKITDISGRGVGMDVVKRNIERIRGKVEVRSFEGKGTTTILRIPLTLAIIDGMIVKVDNTLYVIPIVAIKESFKVDLKQISRTMDGQEIVNVRNKLIPVIRIHELLSSHNDNRDLAEGIIVIVENEGELICLFVDEVVGQQQIVIKGLPDYIGDLKCASGCTILGDGTISLIFDVKGIVKMVEGTDNIDGINSLADSAQILELDEIEA